MRTKTLFGYKAKLTVKIGGKKVDVSDAIITKATHIEINNQILLTRITEAERELSREQNNT